MGTSARGRRPAAQTVTTDAAMGVELEDEVVAQKGEGEKPAVGEEEKIVKEVDTKAIDDGSSDSGHEEESFEVIEEPKKVEENAIEKEASVEEIVVKEE